MFDQDLDTDGNQTNYAGGLKSNGLFDRLTQDCTTNGFVASAKTRYNTLRDTYLNPDHIMQLVQNQYNALVESGAYDREHEAWPEYTVDESQLTYMNNWLKDRFHYLDMEILADCGTWDVEEDTENQAIQVFPNPAKDKINVRFAEVSEAAGSLYDMTGRLIYTDNATTQFFIIPTQNLTKGIYTLVTYTEGKQQVDRVVVE